MKLLKKKWSELTDKQKARFSSKNEFTTKKSNYRDKELSGTKEARAKARERVQKRLNSGEGVNVSNIAEQTGVSEKRAQIIVNRGGLTKKEYQAQNAPLRTDIIPQSAGQKMGPKNPNKPLDKFGKKEIKQALSEGQSTDDIQKQIDRYQKNTDTKVGLKAQAFLDKKISKMKDQKPSNPAPSTPTPPPAPPAPTPPPTATTPPAPPAPPAVTTEPSVDIDTTIKASDNDFTNNGEFTGNNLQGVDASVNIEDAPQPSSAAKAQSFLENKVSEIKESPAPTPTPEPTPEPAATPAPVVAPSTSIDTTVKTSDNKFVNNGSFIGNNLQGVDLSVNIDGDASSNVKSAAGYMAMNDNAFRKSQAEMSGLSRSAQQVKSANLLTNAAEGVANTDYVSRINSLYMGNQATASQASLYGDLFNFEAPEFKRPKPGKKPEDKTQEIADMYND